MDHGNSAQRTLGDLSLVELIDLSMGALSKLMERQGMEDLGTPYAYLSLARDHVIPQGLHPEDIRKAVQ